MIRSVTKNSLGLGIVGKCLKFNNFLGGVFLFLLPIILLKKNTNYDEEKVTGL